MMTMDTLCSSLEEIGMSDPDRRIRVAEFLLNENPDAWRVNSISFQGGARPHLITYSSRYGGQVSAEMTDI